MRSYREILPYAAAAGLLILFAVFSPFLTPMDPYAQDLSMALRPPDSVNLLGTDRYGRDVLSRVIIGAQITICSSLVLLVATAFFGSVIGAFCGLRGGRTDMIIMRLSDVFLAFPEMVFAIAAASVIGGGIKGAAMALILISWPKYARLARGLVLTLRSMPYLEASRMSGSTNREILFDHVLGNIAGPILVTAALNLGTIIMELAGLSFLGLGAMPPAAEWGAMMSNGRSMLQTAPWVILAPGTAIFISVAVFNIFGDRLRDFFDPK
jgi:peptide/nickel transport system permease protein